MDVCTIDMLRVRVATGVAIAVVSLGLGTASAQDVTALDIHGGTVTFDAGTNISAISVHGKSTQLEGRAGIRDEGQGLTIERIDLSIPVKTLETGMSLRDAHMRKYVFTTPDGQTPDIRFEAANQSCASNGGQLTCQATGDLAIRGTARPFTMTVKVKRDGGAYRAVADGEVKLSTYAIDRPSQLGVQTADTVKLHLEFAAKPAPITTASNRSDR